jgi:hypothetical protein
VSEPYKPLTVPVDIEAEKRKQKLLDDWNAKTPLERARIIYENQCIAGVQRDQELRRKQNENFAKAQTEYFRLLGGAK